MYPLYHRIPRDMRGNTLYPLNQLQAVHPDLYERYRKKYEGREHVPQTRIGLFNAALWNDVIFTSAVHPQKLWDARRAAGFPDLPTQRYFEIDPATLDQTKLGVWLFPPGHTHIDEEFVPFDDRNITAYSTLPRATIEYYETLRNEGADEIPLFWRNVPHIMYHGSINVSSVPIIEAH